MATLYCSKQQVEALVNPAFTQDQIHEIRKRTPEAEVETKVDENGFLYRSVKGSYMKNRLNIIFGWDWDFQIVSKEYFAHSREVIVHGKLSIRSNDRTVIKEQFGRHYLSVKTNTSGNVTTTAAVNIGNGYKAAATDAFKKCASEIGLCWDIYEQDRPEPDKKDKPSRNHQTQAVYDRLNHFLQQCATPEEAEQCFKQFEENTEVTEDHEALFDQHIKRLAIR